MSYVHVMTVVIESILGWVVRSFLTALGCARVLLLHLYWSYYCRVGGRDLGTKVVVP